jgi:diguanylate cyclase (GGDEF)-like protein
MIVRLHDLTQRIGSQDTSEGIIREASSALTELIDARGIAHYMLSPAGLLLSEEAGRPADAAPFPSALVVQSYLGGSLAGGPLDDTVGPEPTPMPLGESVDASGIPAMIEVLRTGIDEEIAGVLWIRRATQDEVADPIRSMASVLIDHVGTALRMARTLATVRSMLAAERRRTMFDDLTGVFGRAHFLHEAHREISRSRRFKVPLSALMIDADHFKRVNDDYGHAAGDAVLIALGRILEDVTREIDVVGRLGGEEFGVLLPNATAEGAMVVAERVRAAVAAKPIVVGSAELKITVSIGMAVWREPEDVAALFERADRAMYAAKAAGRDRVEAGA